MLELHLPAEQDVPGVCARVHNVQLGEHACTLQGSCEQPRAASVRGACFTSDTNTCTSRAAMHTSHETLLSERRQLQHPRQAPGIVPFRLLSARSTASHPPMVREPAGSTSRASCSASDVARSAFAGVTARMMAFSPCFTHNSHVSAGPHPNASLQAAQQAEVMKASSFCQSSYRKLDHMCFNQRPGCKCGPWPPAPAQWSAAAHRLAPWSALQHSRKIASYNVVDDATGRLAVSRRNKGRPNSDNQLHSHHICKPRYVC
jgi:hypothetical protein